MQRTLIIIITAVVVVGVVLAGIFWLRAPNAPKGDIKQTVSSTGNTNTTVVTTGGTTVLEKELTVSTLDGNTLQVNDFKKNNLTVEDTNNKDHFYLSGGLDPVKDNAAYSILYVEFDQSFNVAILQEPLGEVRKRAEQELIKLLGVSQTDLCRLRYIVSTPNWVNEIYSGKNLGFSFCPGAVQL